MASLDDLAALLAPLGVAAFFADYYEKQPVHLRDPARRDLRLLTHEELLAALAARPAPPEGLMAFPEHLDPALTLADLTRDADLTRAYLDAGHPLVWNRARGVAPAVDALASLLSEALGAQVWPNVYATGVAGTPFAMHFDGHEVFAVHCQGEKCWQISAVRVDRPLDAPEMAAAVRATLEGRREEAMARPLGVFTVAPGDVVYIPRGQFHNAETTAGRSLHVTFGVRALTGLDVVQTLAALALGDPLFREFLPARPADPDGARAAAQMREIMERIRAILDGAELRAEVRRAAEHLVRRGGG